MPDSRLCKSSSFGIDLALTAGYGLVESVRAESWENKMSVSGRCLCGAVMFTSRNVEAQAQAQAQACARVIAGELACLKVAEVMASIALAVD